MEQPAPVGRPLKFKDPAQLQQKIDEYFGDCDPHIITVKVKRVKDVGGSYWAEEEVMSEQKPYLITGLALALDTSRHTLLDYQNPEHYPESVDESMRDLLINTITRAKLKCESYAESQLFIGRNPSGAQFSLKNNYNYHDKQEIKHSGSVAEDLDDLDGQKEEVANAAAKAVDDAGSAPQE